MNSRPEGTRLVLHASAVAVQGRGCLILGQAGRGKSTLALQMIAEGAVLVADDQTVLEREGRVIALSPPPPLKGRIEARGIGLIQMPSQTAELALIVDLDRSASDRLPPPRFHHLLGLDFPVILGRSRDGLGAILRAILLHSVGSPEQHLG